MSLDWLREGMLSASGNKIHVIIIKVFWLIYLCRRVFKIKLVSWNGKHRGAIACQQKSIIEMLRWKKNGQGHCAPLTIMFSKACLASQQFKKTGMKRFLKDGKITCREKKKCLGLLSSYRSAFICYTVMVSGSKGGSVHLGISSRFQVLDSDVWFFFHRWVGLQCLKAKTNGCLQRLPVPSVLSNAYPSTYSDHEGNSADHLQNERDT